MSLIAIVPARGGSKRIPRKNLVPFMGVPMIERVVRMLVESVLVDRVVVSTDDPEIAVVARSSGAVVPKLRAKDLSDDFTMTAPVVLDALDWPDTSFGPADEVLVAYPTSIFLDDSLISKLLSRFRVNDVEHVFVAVGLGCPVGRSWSRKDEVWTVYNPSTFFERSQDLPEAFCDSGQGYLSRRSAWEKMASGVVPTSAAVVVDRWAAVDIDTESDFKLAEAVYRASRNSRGK